MAGTTLIEHFEENPFETRLQRLSIEPCALQEHHLGWSDGQLYALMLVSHVLLRAMRLLVAPTTRVLSGRLIVPNNLGLPLRRPHSQPQTTAACDPSFLPFFSRGDPSSLRRHPQIKPTEPVRALTAIVTPTKRTIPRC
jgi:hypothetical protein